MLKQQLIVLRVRVPHVSSNREENSVGIERLCCSRSADSIANLQTSVLGEPDLNASGDAWKLLANSRCEVGYICAI